MANRRTPNTALPDDLDLGDADPAQAEAPVPALSRKPVGMPKLYRIVVDEADAIPPSGLMLGLNGKAFLIRPGEEVNVPRAIIEILDHARMSVPKIDSVTRRISGWSDRPRFPYRIVSAAA